MLAIGTAFRVWQIAQKAYVGGIFVKSLLNRYGIPQWVDGIIGITPEELAGARRYLQANPEQKSAPPVSYRGHHILEEDGLRLAQIADVAYLNSQDARSFGRGLVDRNLNDLHPLPSSQAASQSEAHFLAYGFKFTREKYLPAYCLLYSMDGTIYVAVRGTSLWDIGDVMCDLRAGPALVEGKEVCGYAHNGMYRAAKKLLECESESIPHNKKVRARKVVFVGHSLGGGVAALAALLARQSPAWKGVDCHAVTFGAPPLLSEELATGCADYITSYVLDDDPVARLSIANITKALQRLKEYAKRDRERDNGGLGFQDLYKDGGRWFNTDIKPLYGAGKLIHVNNGEGGVWAQVCNTRGSFDDISDEAVPWSIVNLKRLNQILAHHKVANYVTAMGKIIQHQSASNGQKTAILASGALRGEVQGSSDHGWDEDEHLARQLTEEEDTWLAQRIQDEEEFYAAGHGSTAAQDHQKGAVQANLEEVDALLAQQLAEELERLPQQQAQAWTQADTSARARQQVEEDARLARQLVQELAEEEELEASACRKKREAAAQEQQQVAVQAQRKAEAFTQWQPQPSAQAQPDASAQACQQELEDARLAQQMELEQWLKEEDAQNAESCSQKEVATQAQQEAATQACHREEKDARLAKWLAEADAQSAGACNQRELEAQVQHETAMQARLREEKDARLARQLAEDHKVLSKQHQEVSAQAKADTLAQGRQQEEDARLARQLEQQLRLEDEWISEAERQRQEAAQALQKSAAEARQREETDAQLAQQLAQQLVKEEEQNAAANRDMAAQLQQEAAASQMEEEDARLARCLAEEM